MSGVVHRQRHNTTTGPSLGHVRQIVVSWLGLILLALNILGAGILPAQAEGSTPLFAQELLGDRIMICTAAGMVAMDRDGNIIDTQGPSSGYTGFCAYCLPLMHGDAAAPASIVTIQPPAIAAQEPVLIPAATQTVVSTSLRGAATPQAPPAI